jgi:DNA repair protein RecN (Recombination protein N)
MLHELRVENLLLIERAELRLGPGLNVLTGETGAGKTMLAHALDLLLGGKARSAIVRPGAAEAYVEGVFDFPQRLREALGERLPDDAEELVLARRVWPDGRTRAYLNGRSATVGELREIGGELLAFYGQHEHRRLVLASAQLEILDGFCGPEQRERRARAAAAHARLRSLTRRAEELGAIGGARERELGLLEFELSEIDEVDPSEEEQAELERERERLRHLEGLRGAAVAGAEAIAPESGEAGAGLLLASAVSALDALTGVDPELDELAQRYRALVLEADDLGTELRAYEQGIEGEPGRLDEVEDRLADYARLERKHGGTVAAVLAHAAHCRARRDELTGAEAALEETRVELDGARSALDAVAGELRAAREAAGPGLAEAVRERLGELAMGGATFEVALGERDEPNATGNDTVELRIAANPGVPAGPLRDVASGGETSRVMLALLGVANASVNDGAGLLVFDEIDAGIGGRTAHAVGSQLRALAAGRQVLCITHLPQVAAHADRHFRIEKDGGGETATTTVTDLHRDAVLGELVRMLGAEEDDRAARRHARELLKAA